MRATIVTKPGEIEVWEVLDPEPGPYEVLVDVIGCGFCNGTDIKIVEGHWPGLDQMPYILGHEAVGRVVATGSKVRNLKEGQIIIQPRVEGYPEHGIGTAWGGFVEVALAADWKAMQADGLALLNPFVKAQQIVPPEMDPADAIMLITLKEVYSALQGFGIQSGMDVLIYGDGPVGICMAMCARQMGAGKVILSGHHDKRLGLAEQSGATHVINSKKTDLGEFVRDLAPEGLPLIIDAIGSNQVVQQGLDLIADEGHIGIYGYSDQRQATLDWSRAPVRWSIDYLVVPQLDRLTAAHAVLVNWIMDGRVNLKELVTHQISMDQAPETYRLVKTREALKVIVNM